MAASQSWWHWMPDLPPDSVLDTHKGCTAIRSGRLASLFHCQVLASWSPLFAKNFSAVSQQFVLLSVLPPLSFWYSDCPSFSPLFIDLASYVETYGSKSGILALIQTGEQGLAFPIRLQGPLFGSQTALQWPVLTPLVFQVVSKALAVWSSPSPSPIFLCTFHLTKTCFLFECWN